MKYRKKPVVIEAVQWTGDNWNTMIDFIVNQGGDAHTSYRPGDDSLYIRTLEGEMRADNGDFVIRGVQGEFYPCKPDIFDATYEPVEDTQTA